MFAQEALHNVAQATAGASPARQVAHYAKVCRSFPWTRGAVHAEEMVRALLLNELRRIRATQDLGGLDRLDEVEYPDGVKSLWHTARAEIRARASEWAGR